MPGPFEEGVFLWARSKPGSLGFQVVGKVFQSIREGKGLFESATLHDTTSWFTGPNRWVRLPLLFKRGVRVCSVHFWTQVKLGHYVFQTRPPGVKYGQYPGFIDASSGRFVKPGIVQRDETPPLKRDEEKRDNGGNGGGEPPGLHPFVQGLLKELPQAGTAWPEPQRKLWLDTAASIFKMIYKDSDKMPWENSDQK